MEKSNEHYLGLDLTKLARKIPQDMDLREQSEAFQEMLIALALRCKSEQFTSSQLLAYLGQPNAVKRIGEDEVWEYSWQGEHCQKEYRSSTPFVIREGKVSGIRHEELTPLS